MNGAAMKACVGMVCISVVYGSYIVSSAVSGQPIPDGIVLTGVVGAVCALAGVSVGLERANAKKGG